MHINYIASFASFISLAQAMVVLPALSTDLVSTAATIETIYTSSHNATNASSNSSGQEFLHLTKEFVECLKIKVMPSNYVILDNLTLYAAVYANFSSKGLWEYGNYYIDKHNIAFICPPFTTPPSPENNYTQKDVPLSFITVIGMSISLLSLALHFIGFLIVPEMKNLPGKNLASLTISLFFAYFIFLIGKLLFEKTPICYPLGISIYYFMMVSFFWMNAISYDIFKSVRAATTKLRLMSKSTELKWFILYSIYSWLIPAILSGIIVAGDKTTCFPENIRPKFNEGSCWFGHRLSIIIFFALPVAILMLANIIFFIASAVTICSNSMKSDDRTSSLKRNVTLYLKLVIIMGLVWITGLVAGTMENDALSYVFVSLTTLQGLFIFIAFTRFKQTTTHLKERMNTITTIVHSPSIFNSSTFNLSNSKNAALQ